MLPRLSEEQIKALEPVKDGDPYYQEYGKAIADAQYNLIVEKLKSLTPEKVREEVARAIEPLAKNYVLGYIRNLNELEGELKRVLDFYTDQILQIVNAHWEAEIKEEGWVQLPPDSAILEGISNLKNIGGEE